MLELIKKINEEKWPKREKGNKKEQVETAFSTCICLSGREAAAEEQAENLWIPQAGRGAHGKEQQPTKVEITNNTQNKGAALERKQGEVQKSI